MNWIPLSPDAIDLIVIHNSDTPRGRDVSAADIRRWHRERGWLDIGYHYVIRLDGTVEEGRPAGRPGAHVRGYNQRSVGICLIGGTNERDLSVKEDTFTDAQMEALQDLVSGLVRHFYPARVVGHGDLDPKKPHCPGFDVQEWASDFISDTPL